MMTVGLEKKKKKKKKKREKTHRFKPPQNNDLHRHRMSRACARAWFAAAAVVILMYGCRLCVACASGGDQQRRNGRARVSVSSCVMYSSRGAVEPGQPEKKKPSIRGTYW